MRAQLITLLKRKDFLPLEAQSRKFNQAALKSMLRKREFVQPKVRINESVNVRVCACVHACVQFDRKTAYACVYAFVYACL